LFATKLHNGLGNTLCERGTQTVNHILNQLVLAGDESTILDGTTMLADNASDGGEEPKIIQGHQLRIK